MWSTRVFIISVFQTNEFFTKIHIILIFVTNISSISIFGLGWAIQVSKKILSRIFFLKMSSIYFSVQENQDGGYKLCLQWGFSTGGGRKLPTPRGMFTVFMYLISRNFKEFSYTFPGFLWSKWSWSILQCSNTVLSLGRVII